MASNNIEIQVELIAEGVKKGLEEFNQELKKLDDTAKGTSQGFSNFQAGLVTFNQAVQLAGTALRGIESAYNALDTAFSRGQEVSNLARGFDNLQKSAGQDATQALNDLRKETTGLLTDFELMQSANQAVLLGLPTEGFAEASGAAIKLGQAMGIDATKAIESFTTGVGRQSKLMLDNLGILVDTQEAYRNFAEANKIVGRELDENEKKLAFQQEAYRKILDSSENLGEFLNNNGLAFQRLGVAVDNAKDRFFEAIAENKNLQKTFSELAKSIDKIDFDAYAEGVSVLIKATVKGIQIVELFASSLAFLGSDAAKTQKELGTAIQALTENLDNYDDSVQKAINSFRLIDLEANLTKQEIEDYTRKLEGLEFLTSKATDRKEILSYAIGILRRELEFASARTEKFGDTQSEINEILNDTPDKVDKVTSSLKEYKEVIQGIEGIGGIGFVGADGQPLGSQAEQSGFWSNIFSDESSQTLANQFSRIVGDAFSQAISSDETLKRDDYNQLFSQSVSEALGSAADSYAPGSGAIVRPVAQALSTALFDGLADAFGGDTDAQANAREAFVSNIRDIIRESNLQLVVDDELKLLDFNIGRGLFDVTEGNVGIFEDLFALPDNIEGGFLGIGTALAQLSGDADLVGGQVAAILNDELGGSLNNLQLLINELGLSAQDMGQAVEEAYLNGDIAAGEFLNSSAQIEQLFTKGIPGAVGATEEAFKNFAIGGATSGRIAQDALQDLAAEMLELGASSDDTLDALKSNLLESGANAEQVQILFESFAQNGVSSLGQLVDLTVQQTAAITNLAQSSGFAFENTFDSIRETAEALDRLPSEKNVDIVLNISSNVQDSGAQQAVDSGLLGEGL